MLTTTEIAWLLTWLAGPEARRGAFAPAAGGRVLRLADHLRMARGMSWQQWQRVNRELGVPALGGGPRGDSAARKRVLALLEGLEELWRMRLPDIALLRRRSKDAVSDEAWRIADDAAWAINQKLRRYLFRPVVSFRSRIVRQRACESQPEFTLAGIGAGRGLMQEWAAVEMLARLLEGARVWPDRFRRCAECRCWFWASKRWAKHCSPPCREEAKRAYQRSEAYREKRRANYAYEGRFDRKKLRR